MDTLVNTLSKIAPSISNVLNLALPGSGLVLNGLMSLFGVKDEQELNNIIQSDPDAMLKLKKFEQDHALELEKLVQLDRASARNNEIEIAKVKGERDWVRPFLVVSTTILFIALCFIIAFTNRDNSDKDLFYLLIGTVNTVWAGSIFGYYFGAVSPGKFNSQDRNFKVNLPPPESTR